MGSGAPFSPFISYEFLANDLSIAGSWIMGGRPDFDIVVVEEGVRSEAVWSADLTGVINPELRFEHAAWNDSSTHLPIGFQGSVQGDGVSNSIDGETWYRAFTPAGESELGNWSTESINLQAVANLAGVQNIEFTSRSNIDRSSGRFRCRRRYGQR